MEGHKKIDRSTINSLSLPSFTEFSKTTQSHPGTESTNYTMYYRVFTGFTGFYWVLLGLTGFCWALMRPSCKVVKRCPVTAGLGLAEPLKGPSSFSLLQVLR